MSQERPDFAVCLARCQALTEQGELTEQIEFVHALLSRPDWTPYERLCFEQHEVWAALSIQRDPAFVQRVLTLVNRAQALDDRLLLLHSYLLQARMQGRLRMTSAALQSIGRAQALLMRSDRQDVVWRLHNVMGFVLFEAGRFDALVDTLGPMLPGVNVLEDAALAPHLYSPATLLAAAHAQLDHIEVATQWRTALLALSRTRGWARREVSSAMNLATMHLLAGRVELGRLHLEAAEQVATRVRCSSEANVLLVLTRGLLTWKEGHAAEALPIMRRARDMAERDQEWIALERVLLRTQACAMASGDLACALDACTAHAGLMERLLRETERLGDFCLAAVAEQAQLQAGLRYAAGREGVLAQELLADRAALESSIHERTTALQRASQALAQQQKQAELSALMVSVASALEHPLEQVRGAIHRLQGAALSHQQQFEGARLRRTDVEHFHQEAGEAVRHSMNELLHTAGLVRMFRSLSSHAAQEARIPCRVDMVIRAALPILQAKASATRHALACGELLPLQLQMDPAALTLVLGELLDQLPVAVPAPPLETADPGETQAPAPTPPGRTGRRLNLTLEREDCQLTLTLSRPGDGAGPPPLDDTQQLAWQLLKRLCEQALGCRLRTLAGQGGLDWGVQLVWPCPDA